MLFILFVFFPIEILINCVLNNDIFFLSLILSIVNVFTELSNKFTPIPKIKNNTI